jgi:hypothetical protein
VDLNKAEDYAGVNPSATHERNRGHSAPGPQRYLKHVHDGNTAPYLPDFGAPAPVPPPAVARHARWSWSNGRPQIADPIGERAIGGERDDWI